MCRKLHARGAGTRRSPCPPAVPRDLQRFLNHRRALLCLRRGTRRRLSPENHRVAAREGSGEQHGRDRRTLGHTGACTQSKAHRERIASSHEDAADGHASQQRARPPVCTSDQRTAGASGCGSTGKNWGRLASAPASAHGPLLTPHSPPHLSPLPTPLGWFRTCPTAVTSKQLSRGCAGEVQPRRQPGGRGIFFFFSSKCVQYHVVLI